MDPLLGFAIDPFLDDPVKRWWWEKHIREKVVEHICASDIVGTNILHILFADELFSPP